jgi:glycogen synthase
MKILVISNNYPPYFVGGYELGCREVVDKLSARGHTLRVLTSTYGTEQGTHGPEPGVERLLHFDPSPGPSGRLRIVNECRIFRRVVKDFSPDVIYFWNQTGLCYWLSPCAQLMGQKCVFFISDTAFTAWRVGAFLFRFVNSQPRTPSDARIQGLIRALFGQTWLLKGYPVIHRQPCHFVSAFLENHAYRAGIDVSDSLSKVIHWGTDPTRFKAISGAGRWPPRKLLYVGQVIAHKGVHTAVEALALLARKPEFADMTLSIAGGSTSPEYEKRLRALPANLGIADKVRFLGKLSGGELPAVYREHDLLVFPSTWEEPFAITPLEAMASMLPVAGTLTGGSRELFRDRETAMTFQAGDAASCAAALEQLCSDRELFESIRARAFKLVATHHTIDGMVDRIETALKRVASGENSA